MLEPLVQWYHEFTVHSTGMDHLEAIILTPFFHPALQKICQKVVSNCQICPQVCTGSHPTGALAPCTAPVLPWFEVHINFIGPWNVKVNKQKMRFDTLTCIVPVTNLIKIVRLQCPKTADNAPHLFKKHWLSQYPRPAKVIHDHSPQFRGHNFQFSLIIPVSKLSTSHLTLILEILY